MRGADALGNTDQSPAARAFAVQRPSDLAVWLTATPQPVKSKAQLAFNATVTNDGPADNSGVSFTQAIPAQTTVLSVMSSVGACTTSGAPAVVTCAVGPLANGATATVDVVVKVDAKRGATLTSTAQVTGARSDPDASDNAATVSTSVR